MNDQLFKINTCFGEADLAISYPWDDGQVRAILKYDTDSLLERIEPASLRAKTVLAIGIYEWIIWRYRLLHDDSIPFQIAEASWCAAIDKRYIQYVELVRSEYTGPIKGPLRRGPRKQPLPV